jgi:hypothetical protein
MPNIQVEMTEAELFALDLVAADHQDYADNVLTNRARIAKDELKNSGKWTDALVALSNDGGDATDDWAVLLKGKELGLFKTAKEIVDLQELAGPDQAVTEETVPTDIALNPVQFFTLLETAFNKTEQDVIDQINASAMTDAEKVAARNRLSRSTLYHRDNPLFDMLAGPLNITSEQIDTAWEQALQI